MNKVSIEQVKLDGELYYKIAHADLMRPFFMSIVSDSNHWLFISSNGGLTAGRKNSAYALFPYYTDDKLTELAEVTGSKSIFRVESNGRIMIWEPFSIRNPHGFKTSRHLYKNIYGNKLRFEEVNEDLGLSYSYEWCSSNAYGFVRKSKLTNLTDKTVNIDCLDGIQNVLPYGVPSDLQNATSNLVDAYKRTELDANSGLVIFALSAIIVDRAEPSEALKANVAWSAGLDNPKYLLSSLQLESFRNTGDINTEKDIKGEKGAYLLNFKSNLYPGSDKEWMIVANVNQSQSNIASLIKMINTDADIRRKLNNDIERGTDKLIALNASADGLQCTADHLRDTRHFANALFNAMRGGIFDHNYQIEKWDFSHYLSHASKRVFENNSSAIQALPDVFSLQELKDWMSGIEDNDLVRLATEYLPLKFSRRHGDPSRPWNKFSINTINETDGSKVLDYQGNWRDIFQNWEALAHSFPEFMEGMISRFLNASTFDGYNPYRVTKGGFDWETIEPDDPWSYIGYWGDHQIIYLLKFLEFIEDHKPGKLNSYFDKDMFVYANVPYRIKSYEAIVQNPKDTIDFDSKSDHAIRKRIEQMGADGALLTNLSGDIHRVNFIEKIMATVLAKLANYIPEGGIWMNTQRPEWNDANNALVGNGISMVTLYYLRRFLRFFQGILEASDKENISLSSELLQFFSNTAPCFDTKTNSFDDTARKKMMDQLGTAASEYREKIYNRSFSGDRKHISIATLRAFTKTALVHLESSIQANRRKDGLYHAYNLLDIHKDEAHISYLSEMLEGQVAVLSSGFLSSEESLELLDALKKSALFREDQYSYILYPNKELPGFLQKNTIPPELAEKSELIKTLIEQGDTRIVEKDAFGKLHFNGNFRNAGDLNDALGTLRNGRYQTLVEKGSDQVKDIFEKVFNHKAFTGRSGTFFGYEGLGSIYWHMVSKLLLAVQDVCIEAIANNEDPSVTGRLLEHFYEINEGIGVHKSPQLYGAFPTDPYSHTPANKGAQQPGMTGQVKEDLLSRFGELGVRVQGGKLLFDPCLLRKDEFLVSEKTFKYYDVQGREKEYNLKPGTLAFTYCQVPVIYKASDRNRLELVYSDGHTETSDSLSLDDKQSQLVFQRKAKISEIHVEIDKQILK